MARCIPAPWMIRTFLFAGAFVFNLELTARLQAADKATEQRDFTVLVDGSPAGGFSMTITDHDDSSQTMSALANVKVSYFGGLKTYRYSYQGTESWNAGRLVRFSSSSNDDGKEFNVSAAAERAGLRIRVNGRDRITRPDNWLSTYWRLPDPKFRNGGVPLVDADTGKDLAVQLHHVGGRQMKVAGTVQNCNQYQITGEVQVELWFDAQERLIQLKSVSEGHKYELVLTGIRR